MLLRPVILIHDLGGSPQDWDRWGVVSRLVNEGGLDPRLIRRFDYGYVRHGTVPRYDAQGDLIQIAHRLSDDPALPGGEAFQVDALAAESRALGGADKVSIVAVGAGGIIARYYLSRRVPDALGTRYNGNVDKAILVGTPNMGARLGAIAGRWRRQMGWRRLLLPACSKAAMAGVFAGFEALRDRVLDEMRGQSGPPISPKSLGLLQISETSFLLRWLNRSDCAPKEVRFWCLAGRIVIRFLSSASGDGAPVTLNAGDLLVSEKSATTIPGAAPVAVSFDSTYEVDLRRAEAADPLAWFGGDLPPYAHTRLMQQPEVHQAILDTLTGRASPRCKQ